MHSIGLADYLSCAKILSICQQNAKVFVLKPFDVSIKSIATAVPSFKYDQEEAHKRSKKMLPLFSSMGTIFKHTGVGTRYSCVPTDWYMKPPGWKESNEIYIDNCLALLEHASTQALSESGVTPEEISAIVCVSSTGLAIPSLEARLSNRLHFNQRAERLPIFGLGCAGGTSGLARAARMAQTIEDGYTMLLVAELAGINVHVNQENSALFVSTALFGDGAAAVLLQNDLGTSEPGSVEQTNGKRVVAVGEYQWRDTEHIMGWKVMDDGLDVVLSSTLPKFTEVNLRYVVEEFLQRHGFKLSDLEGYVCHPGGRKVLEAIASALDIDDVALKHSRDVLDEFGNMSAPTVLFILERTIRSNATGLHLMISFGPAFTATFVLLDL